MSGSIATAIAIGSGRSNPLSFVSVRQNSRRTRCGSTTYSPSGPSARISAASSSEITASATETSQPTISRGMPDSKTICAASGSTQKLNSASGVTFPGSTPVPPIITQRRTHEANFGSARTARATFVSGPSVTRSIWPGLFRNASISASTPAVDVGVRPRSGRPMSPMPSLPWTFCAVTNDRTSARSAPA